MPWKDHDAVACPPAAPDYLALSIGGGGAMAMRG